jgi:hypothetical protein
LETIFCRSLTLCLPKQRPRRGGGLRQINTAEKYLLDAFNTIQVNVFGFVF